MLFYLAYFLITLGKFFNIYFHPVLLPMEFSLAEENYIKTIYHLGNQEKPPISTNAIAQEMDTRPASVSDMVKKLARKGIVMYTPYRGVELTPEGHRLALLLIRKHRLWEVFLVRYLRFQWDQVHEVAEQLEHIQSERLIERLDAFLGYPKYDPHGDPIPDREGKLPKQLKAPLAEAEVGQELEVVAVQDTSTAFLKYLDRIGIYIGAKVRVTDRIEFDGSSELEIDGKHSVFASKEVVSNILVAAQDSEIEN